MFVGARTRKIVLTVMLAALLLPGKLPASANGIRSDRIAVTESALHNANFGFFPAKDFRMATGECNDCSTPKRALWYFENDLIAVPRTGFSTAGLATTSSGYQSVLRGAQEISHHSQLPYPAVIWLGSPEIVTGVNLSHDGKTLGTHDGAKIEFSLVPKIPTNRSYYNESSLEFFRQRSLRIRGATHTRNSAHIFVARTIWPEDFRVEAADLTLAPLYENGKISDPITAQNGGATGTFQTRLLWEGAPGKDRNWTGLPVLALLLSGAQGDDDESQAGHLAVVTGRVDPNSEMADWIVSNFYDLDEMSEKGIIASMLPIDNYLLDLNSGQSYYRPTYLLLAVLKDSRAASRFQAAIEPLYNHFYRHDFLYHHSKINCTGIDTLRAIGWEIPPKGVTSYVQAAAAFAYLSVKDRSLTSGKKMFDFLTEEQTRLFPRAAFEAASEDLLAIVNGEAERSGRQLTGVERMLRDDAVALLFIRIPQIPSSRAFGTYPVASFDEYRSRVPADRAKWKIVAVDARPFPEALREPLPAEGRAINWPAMAIWIFVIALGEISRRLIRNRSRSKFS